MIKIAILDDHPVVTNGLKNVLAGATNFLVTAVFNSAEALLKDAANLDADVLILDMQLADGSGYDVATTLLKKKPALGILVFSSTDTVYLVKKMQQAGCRGYILKNADTNTIFKAVAAVHEGTRFLSPEIEKALMDDMFASKNAKTKKLTLTRREQEVLQLIAKESTTQEIANELFLSPSAVEFHRTNLLQKFGAKNSVGLIKVAIEAGLI